MTFKTGSDLTNAICTQASDVYNVQMYTLTQQPRRKFWMDEVDVLPDLSRTSFLIQPVRDFSFLLVCVYVSLSRSLRIPG